MESPGQGAVTHKVNGSLEHIHGPAVRDIRQAEANGFVAAGGVALETAAVPVVGAPQAGEGSLAVPTVADEHAVVVPGVLIQQSGVEKAADDARCDPAFFQVGAHPAGIGVPRRQCKRFRRFRRLLSLPVPLRGGISGAAVECQQILHRLGETPAAKMLQKGDGVPAHSLGVAVPGAAVLDPQAVHLLGGVVVAYPRYGVAERRQQVRQVRPAGDLHLLFCETIGSRF